MSLTIIVLIALITFVRKIGFTTFKRGRWKDEVEGLSPFPFVFWGVIEMPNGIGDVPFPEGDKNLFEMIRILRQLGLKLGEQKKILWVWMIQERADRNHDVQLLLFGEISEDEFCRRHPEHPACR